MSAGAIGFRTVSARLLDRGALHCGSGALTQCASAGSSLVATQYAPLTPVRFTNREARAPVCVVDLQARLLMDGTRAVWDEAVGFGDEIDARM